MNKWIAALSFLMLSQMLFAQAAKTESNKRIDSLLQTFYRDSLPGAAIAITENNNIIFEKGYGVRSTQSKEKTDATTNFNIASLTKQFTAFQPRVMVVFILRCKIICFGLRH